MAKNTVVAVTAALMASVSSQALSQGHGGVTVNVLTFTGPVISEPLQRRAPDFEAMTGADVNVITVPFADLYSKILTDFATGTNSIDAIVFPPQWLVDFVEPGFLMPIDDMIANDPDIAWDEIGAFFRDFSASFGGSTYTVPLDGDFHMVYYRKDLLEAAGMEPPATWDEYLEVAEHFHGQDLNDDGTADYGSCVTMKRNAQSYWMIYSVAAPMLQYEGTQQGVFFDRETMEPLVRNPGMRRAMEIYRSLVDLGPPDQLNHDIGDARNTFLTGRCALIMDWGDTGALAIDPETSQVIDRVGAIITPGSREVYDRDAGEMVECTPDICPHAEDGINHAPFSAFGGWSGAISAAADPDVQQAAYDFISYMTAPAQSDIDVTIGITGFNPYRSSHFEQLETWTDAGMSEEFARSYLGAIRNSLENPNMVLDLRIPFNQRYQQTVLDTVIHRMASGEISIDQAMDTLHEGWTEITEEVGVDTQLEAYKASLGIDARL